MNWRAPVVLVGLLLPACFVDSEPSDPMMAGSGDDDGTVGAGDGSGGMAGVDSTGTDVGESGSGESGVADTGVQPTILFDFYEHACDAMVERFGFNAQTDAFGVFECGGPGPLGAVEQRDTTMLASGDSGARVAVLALSPSGMSQVSLDTVDNLALIGTTDPVFRASIDCPGQADGTFRWQITYSSEQDNALGPAAEGVHICGDPSTIVEAPIANAADRTIALVAISMTDGPVSAAFVDPRVIASGG